MRLFDIHFFHFFRMVLAMVLALLFGQGKAETGLTFQGGASISLGKIVKSSDTTSFKYSGNRLQTVSAQLLMQNQIQENFRIAVGLGILERHFPSGNIGNLGGRTPFFTSPYLVNADFNYSWWNTERSKLSLTGGYFPYTYNAEVKNLGLYLLRGPVYPGVIVSGFEAKHTKPVSNTLGLRLQYVLGGFEQNLILNTETETYPHYDISPAYLASMTFGQALKIEAGVNFSHLIKMTPKLTSPDTLANDGSDKPTDYNIDHNTRTWVYIDSITHEVTYLSFAGTKLMANVCFDPKAFFESELFGPEDLKFYGEIALIGLDMRPAYKAVYGDYLHRMPIMGGFNFPGFKFVDHISLEVEWYGAKFKDDLARYQPSTGNLNSPLPVANRYGLNLSRDDWKWSLHTQKTLGQIRFSAQVANDHSRSGGTRTAQSQEWETYFITPKDWYWMTRVGFFF